MEMAAAFSNPGYPDVALFNPVTEQFANMRLGDARPYGGTADDDVDRSVLMKTDDYFKCSTLTSRSSLSKVDNGDVILQQQVAGNERTKSKIGANVLYGELVVYGYEIYSFIFIFYSTPFRGRVLSSGFPKSLKSTIFKISLFSYRALDKEVFTPGITNTALYPSHVAITW